MEENEARVEIKLLEQRLGNIENIVSEVKQLLINDKLQAKDIASLNEKVDRCFKRCDELHDRIKKLELAPMKAGAEKWKTIFDMVFKAVLGAIIGFTLVKIGLK